MSYKLYTDVNIINKPMKCYCDDSQFLISEFNITNLKYEQFKWISVPSEVESATDPNTQNLFAHIQHCRHEKNFNKGELLLCCVTLF